MRFHKPTIILYSLQLLSAAPCIAFTTTTSQTLFISSQLIHKSTYSRQSRNTADIIANRFHTTTATRRNGNTSLSASLRRPLLSEDDLAEPPDSNVIDAVEKLGGTKVLASDVAAKAGVSLSTARKTLSSLASLTAGEISVTNDGDLLYTFPSSLKSALQSNSLRYRITTTWQKDIWPKLFWSIRVGFGVFLFISILAVFSTLIFIQSGGTSSDRDDRDDRRRGGGGGGFGMNLMFDLFYPRPYLYSPYYGYYGRYDPYLSRGISTYDDDDDNEPEPNMFERIFSYIFGDGNPNRGLEEYRLREAARIIRKNGGSVVAEQLAPFCDVDEIPPSGEKSSYVDESFVLPIVSRLGGEPVVTEDGDIVYVFKDLQVSSMTTANSSSAGNKATRSISNQSTPKTGSQLLDALATLSNRDSIGDEDEVLEEKMLEFNRNGAGWNLFAGGLGAINLAGAIYLGQVLSSPALIGYRLPAWYGLVQSGYPLLLAYAILFNVIPLARNVYNQKLNSEAEKRNETRRQWLVKLKSGSSKLKRKLLAASNLRQKMRRLGSGDVIYDTSRDFASVKADVEADKMKEFDKLLNDPDSDSFQ